MKKRTYLPTLALLGLLSYAAPAAASNFSYSYLDISLEGLVFDEELRIGNVYFEGINGASLSGSYQFTDMLYVSLEGSYLDNDGFGTEISAGTGALSLGAAFAAANATDIFVQIGTGNTEVEVCDSGFCVKDDESSIILGAGVRHLVSQSLEIRAGAGYASASEYDGNVSIGAETRWWIDDSSSLHLGITVDENSNTGASIGYRYTFNWAR